jgi:hypothetical protein
MDYIADLACGDMLLKDLKHGADCILGVDRSGLRKVRVDLGEEFFTRPDLLRLPGWVPRFVVDAADEHWELVAQLGRLVDRSPYRKPKWLTIACESGDIRCYGRCL